MSAATLPWAMSARISYSRRVRPYMRARSEQRWEISTPHMGEAIVFCAGSSSSALSAVSSKAGSGAGELAEMLHVSEYALVVARIIPRTTIAITTANNATYHERKTGQVELLGFEALKENALTIGNKMDDKLIPNLWAVGEMSNREFFSDFYVGGNSLATSSTMGRLAAIAAVSEL